MNYENIPDQLRSIPQWVCHKNKQPYDPRIGTKAKANDPDTWTDFYTCSEYARAYPEKYDGIGFEIQPLFVGIDLDHVVDPLTGVIEPWAKTIVDKLDSYTEYSPSGTGLHIFVYGTLPDGGNKRIIDKEKRQAIEMYGKNRYFTVTGNVLKNQPICERQAELEEVFYSLIAKKQDKPTETPPVRLNAPEYLRRGLDKDKLFCALYDGHRGTEDESSNDMALMNKLAYWCNGNVEQMIAAFRASPYAAQKDEEHQKKLQRDDYMLRTAQEAAQSLRSTAAADDEAYRRERAKEAFAPDPKKSVELETISAPDLQDKDLPPAVFVIKKFLTSGLAMLSALPKSGKSWMVLDMCISVASGIPFLGYETNQAGCLYLALEDTQRRLKDRMNKLLNGRRAPECFEFATSAHDLDNGLIQQLEGHVAKRPDTKLIVIDTLQKIRGRKKGNEDSYSDDYRTTSTLKAFADKHTLCILLVHHLRKMKDTDDPFNQISGTNGIFGGLDTSIVLTREKRSDKDAKLSITGRDIDYQEKVVTFENGKWSMRGDADFLERERARLEYENSPIVKTIRKLLEQSPEKRWDGTAKDLLESGKILAGTYIATTAQDLGYKLKALDSALFNNDQIIHSANTRGGAGKKHHFYYSNFTACAENAQTTLK